jgi:hypothetical protein
MTKRFRPAALAFLLVLIAAPSARGGGPSGSPGEPVAGVPTDRLEIRLNPLPARAARALRAEAADGERPRLPTLGLASVDRFAARWPGVRFEPEFRGETAPPAGSDAVDFTAFWRVLLPAGADVAGALEQLRALPEVASADSIALLHVSAIPNDSLWSVSTWFDQPSGHDVQAPGAWDITVGDTNVVVGIIDTGVIPYHPDLAAQMWTNWAEAGGVPGVDDDGNGFIDDIHGWDFVHLSSSTNIAPGEDWSDARDRRLDFAGHGKKIAASSGRDEQRGRRRGRGVGAAPDAAARELGRNKSARSASWDMSYVAEALRYATRMGATKIVNCSFETANLGGMLAAASEVTRGARDRTPPATAAGRITRSVMRQDVISVAGPIERRDPGLLEQAATWTSRPRRRRRVHVKTTRTGADSIGSRQPAYDATIDGTSFGAVRHGRRRWCRRIAAHSARALRRWRWCCACDGRRHPLRGEPSTTGFAPGVWTSRALGDPPTSCAAHRRPQSAAVVLPTRSVPRAWPSSRTTAGC